MLIYVCCKLLVSSQTVMQASCETKVLTHQFYYIVNGVRLFHKIHVSRPDPFFTGGAYQLEIVKEKGLVVCPYHNNNHF